MLDKILLNNEEVLMSKILKYASLHDYVKYTSTLKEAWRLSISELSRSISDAYKLDNKVPELHVEDNYSNDPISEFGTIEAKKHRDRGITLQMFLGLMKYYRQTYVDLIKETVENEKDKEYYELFINRCYDRIEISFCKEWTATSESNKLNDLQTENRIMTNEKNKYLTIFESLQSPVVLLDENDEILNINFSASDLFFENYSPGNLYYKKNKIKAPDWLNKCISYFSKQTYGAPLEIYLNTPSGSKLYRIWCRPMLDVSGKFTGSTLLFEDITKDKENEQYLEQVVKERTKEIESHKDELLRIKERLEERVEMEIAAKRKGEQLLQAQSKLASMGEMIGAIAHQWRQPLNALGLLIQDMVLSKELGEADDNYMGMFEEKSLNLIDSMSTTINDFRNFFIPEGNNNEFNILGVICDTLKLLDSQLKFYNVNFNICYQKGDRANYWQNEIPSCSNDEQIMIQGKPGELKQVLINIVNNARDIITENFSRRERSKALIKIVISQDENHAVITVEDNGGGISEENQKKIFEPYFTTKPAEKGTGLGLYLSKIIIEDNFNGSLSVKSADKKTAFKISIPIKN